MESPLIVVVIAMGLLALILGAMLLGYRTGQARSCDDEERAQVGIIQGAMLALLGLILGLAFSAATSRFVERQALMVREGNALGTAYLRSQLLPHAEGEEVRGLLRAFADERIKLYEVVNGSEEQARIEALASLQQRLWAKALDATKREPSILMGVLPALNEVFDALGTRNAAVRQHVPKLVHVVLLLCVVLAMFTLGYSCGMTKRRVRPMLLALGVMIWGVMWTTLDLDYPRRGLVRVDATPLLESRAGMD